MRRWRKIKRARSHHASRRAAVERELADAQRKLERVLDALADRDLPTDEINARLTAEKARKSKLTAELAWLDHLASATTLDMEDLNRDLQGTAADVAGLVGKQTVRARQMLRKILAGKIDLEPFGSGRERGYKFRGALTIEKADRRRGVPAHDAN
jgi:chromosome segregation ATPase